jgi:hypothetical protein
MLRELPNLICSHILNGNISFLRNGKEARKSKESPLCKGRFLNSCILLRFGKTLGLMLSSAFPSGEHAHIGTSPTTKGGTPYSSSRHLIHTYLVHKVCNHLEKENHFISRVTKLYLNCHLPFNRSWKPPSSCFFFFLIFF